MTKFTVKVRADRGDEGSNKIEVFLDTEPKKEIMVLTTDGNSLDDMDEEVEQQDVALYYAVERIAQLEAQLEQYKAMKMELMRYRYRYAGAIGLLADLSGHYRLANKHEEEEAVESMRQAAADWCEFSGWSYRVIGHKLDLISPEELNG
jgi:uncharacterized protein YutE (UPF0331/DUF86 family)